MKQNICALDISIRFTVIQHSGKKRHTFACKTINHFPHIEHATIYCRLYSSYVKSIKFAKFRSLAKWIFIMRTVFAYFDCHECAFQFHSLWRCFFHRQLNICLMFAKTWREKNLVDISFDRIFPPPRNIYGKLTRSIWYENKNELVHVTDGNFRENCFMMDSKTLFLN